jgi:hypothetical protein
MPGYHPINASSGLTATLAAKRGKRLNQLLFFSKRLQIQRQFGIMRLCFIQKVCRVASNRQK